MKRFEEVSQVTAVIPTYGDDTCVTDRLENVLEQSHRPYEVIVISFGHSFRDVLLGPYRKYTRFIPIASPKDMAELPIRTPHTVIVNPGEWLTATDFEAMELAMDLHPECSAGQANRLMTTNTEDLIQETFVPYFGVLAEHEANYRLKTPAAIFRTNQGWTANWNDTCLEVFNEDRNTKIYGIPFPLGHHYENENSLPFKENIVAMPRKAPLHNKVKEPRTHEHWSNYPPSKARRPL